MDFTRYRRTLDKLNLVIPEYNMNERTTLKLISQITYCCNFYDALPKQGLEIGGPGTWYEF